MVMAIPLSKLDPHWIASSARPGSSELTIETAQGIRFLCPVCFQKHGEAGTHSVLCWFKGRGVPDGLSPGPGRWTPSGTGFADLTLAPSVNLSGPGCGWHGFLTNGMVT
jgi:hypothetical protein